MGFYNFWEEKLRSTRILNNGRDIIKKWAVEYSKQTNSKVLTVLDLGAGKGDDLFNVKGAVKRKCRLYAVEAYPPSVKILEENNVTVFRKDIERNSIPLPDKSVDIIIINQVIEHTKEIFWIFGEISRVLKPKGICIVGFPNLAAWHNRLLILFGRQPSSSLTFGPHVRSLTKKDFMNFVEQENYFKVTGFEGSNFYPFPYKAAKFLGSVFPNASVCIFFRVERTGKKGNYIDVLDHNFFPTPYFRGDNEPYKKPGEEDEQ